MVNNHSLKVNHIEIKIDKEYFMSLPQHGKINCRHCFNSADSNMFKPHPLWQLRDDPGAWGGSAPEILVIGFSKGSTQANIYEKGNFEDVAFGGLARIRLDQALKRVGLLSYNEHVTNHIENPKYKFAFGSLVRCSLTRETKDGKHLSSGPLIVKSFKEIPNILENCAQKFIGDLPKCTKTILMLGISSAYIKGCFKLLSRIYPKLQKINSVSYYDGSRLFVHITHPSPGNGHFSSWKKGNIKFDEALTALKIPLESEGSSGNHHNIIKECSMTISKNNAIKTDKKESLMKPNINSLELGKHKKDGRIPVSTIKTGCIPFNRKQISKNGYKIGENPVKTQGYFVESFDDALSQLSAMNTPGWRDYGDSSSAHKGIAWVTREDAQRLLDEKNKVNRVSLFHSLKDVLVC